MAHSQHRLPGDSFRQSDLPLLAPNFSQNHVRLNEEELVLPLTRLYLHKSSQSGNEVSFLIPLLYSAKFQYLLRINFCMQLNEISIEKSKKCMKMSACPIFPLEFQSKVPIPDRHYGLPIGKPDFQSEF